jgi:hypothetical protein
VAGGLAVDKNTLDPHNERMQALLASYAGPNAETADHAKQKEAEAALSAGEDKYKTFDNTGWFVGPDGRPRFEIDDSKAKFDWSKFKDVKSNPRPEMPTYGASDLSPEASAAWKKYVEDTMSYKSSAADQEVYLKDILDHPALYKAYPQLKGVKVRVGDVFPYATAGTATEGDRSIEFGPMGKDSNGLLLHEVQHLIQRIEGFAQGATMADPNYRRSAGEQEAYDTMYRFLDPKRKADNKGWGQDDPRYKGKAFTKGKYPHLLKAPDDPTEGMSQGGPMIIDLGAKGKTEMPRAPAISLPPRMTAPLPTAPLDNDIQYLKSLP